MKYLGHWFSADGVSPDEGKLQAIAEMPLPQCLADVRFLGMATYLAKFIPQLSQITEPLRQLAKRAPFLMDDLLQQAFITARGEIVNALRCCPIFAWIETCRLLLVVMLHH